MSKHAPFAAALQYWADRRGISKKELGRRVNVNEVTIAKWMRGDTAASVSHLNAVAAALDVSIVEFFSKP